MFLSVCHKFCTTVRDKRKFSPEAVNTLYIQTESLYYWLTAAQWPFLSRF